MSIATTYPSHQEAHKHGWFSRRHQSMDAHRDAQDHWRQGREDKKAREDYQHETTEIKRAERKAAMVPTLYAVSADVIKESLRARS